MAALLNTGDVAVLLRRVLPLRAVYGLARLHGDFVYLAHPARRRAVAANLAPFARDATELRRLTRRFFELRQVRVMMLLLFLDLDPEEWQHHIEIDGLEHLDEALAAGRGVIFLGSHLNSIGVFMSVMVLRQRGYDIQVALPSDAELFPPSRIGRLLRRRSGSASLKDLLGGFFVQLNVRPIVTRLAKNVVIGQTGDGWHSAAFAQVPFFGRTLPFTTGMMSVAQATGATVVPFNVVGEPPNLRCSISGPITVAKGDDPERQLVSAVATYAQRLEADIRANVACWEHWMTPATLDTMASWPQRPLRDRLEV